VPDYEAQRARMVERQLRRREISDERVLEAMAEVPRERFVSERLGRRAYADSALPIGGRQTISQPWIVAAICQGLELEGHETVLEIGTGSGYSAAVLARLAERVISIERVAELAEQARRTLDELGVKNVDVRIGDGTRGARDDAPFEAIAVHATAPAPPHTLIGQLADGGRLVIPVADDGVDLLTAFEAHGDQIERRVIAPCRFVPLVGEEGYGER
jgi:protein-L-isoaspartate(D-aspartate) O-methyltransferase